MSLPESTWRRVETAPFLDPTDENIRAVNLEPETLWRLRWQWWPAWAMLIVPLPLYALYGTSNDWLRHGIYVLLALLCWAIWRGQSDFAVMVFLVGLIPLANWHFADTTSAVNALHLGLPVFGLVAGLAVYGLGAYFGRRFAGLGLLIAGLCLGWQAARPDFDQWPVVALTLLAMAAMGVHQRRTLNTLEQAALALEQTNTLDGLTGLENDRALHLSFDRYAAMARRREMPLLVSMWDLDDLKGTNDREGRAAGDERIRAFARLLHGNARADDAVFRTGDDEFVGLHLGLEDGRSLVERVIERSGGVSVGWALVDEGNLEDALMRASAMLRTHKAGLPISLATTTITTATSELN
jgi:GGDEF domain-containing protein